MSLPIQIRPLRLDAPSEYAFVRSSWVHSAVRHLPLEERERFLEIQPRVVTALLSRGRTLLATSKEDDDIFVGFVTGELCENPKGNHTKVHYLYVKNVFREMGLARALLHAIANGKTGPGRIMATYFTDAKMAARIQERGWHVDLCYPLYVTLEHEGKSDGRENPSQLPEIRA